MARLYSDGRFQAQVASQFEGDYKLKFHLAPPATAPRDPATGQPRKQEFGPAMMLGFKALAKLKGLRGSRLDPFGRNPERVTERQLIADYVAVVEELLTGLSSANRHLAVEIAAIPEQIRGFGYVKEEHLRKAKAAEAELLSRWRRPPPTISAAAE